jgi:hypothetical protein
VGTQLQEPRLNLLHGLVLSGVLAGLANAAGTIAGFVTMPSVSQLVCLLIAAGASAIIGGTKRQTLTTENAHYP